MLTPVSRFSLASHDGPYERWPLRTPLIVDGVATAREVPGYVIEGQYQWDDYALLINSWDCLFEESYDFLLLDSELRIVARRSLGVPYGTYLLHAHWPIDADSLRLHFYERQCFTLAIQPPSRFWRRRHSLRLTSHLLTPTDEPTQRSIRELDATLASMRVTPRRPRRP